MDLVIKVVGFLGAIGTARGLFNIWSGWETYALGKKNDNPQEQDRGQAGMLYGAMLAAGSAGIAAAIVAALQGIAF